MIRKTSRNKFSLFNIKMIKLRINREKLLFVHFYASFASCCSFSSRREVLSFQFHGPSYIEQLQIHFIAEVLFHDDNCCYLYYGYYSFAVQTYYIIYSNFSPRLNFTAISLQFYCAQPFYYVLNNNMYLFLFLLHVPTFIYLSLRIKGVM